MCLLGREFAANTRLPLDLNKALLLFQKACKLGRLDSCVRINNIKFKLLKKLDEETYQSNLKYFLDQNSSFALLEHITTVGGKIKCRKRKIKCRIFATNYLSFNLKLKL